MGMYDEIICRYPLPTTPPFWATPDKRYQTKDLECRLATYEITAEGELRQCGGGRSEKEIDNTPISFDGTLEFYDDNCSAGDYGTVFTPDGSDYEWVTYEAIFVAGKVKEIVETERERTPALSRAVYDSLQTMFQEDRPTIDLSEPEVGAEMYVLWGNLDRKLDGYPARLISKTPRWSFRTEDGRMETIDRHQLGNCLFHSAADAKAQRTWEHRLWDRKAEYCKELLQAQAESRS